MEGNIRLGCPWCDTNIIVMPPDLYEALGQWGGLEAQVEFSHTYPHINYTTSSGAKAAVRGQ